MEISNVEPKEWEQFQNDVNRLVEVVTSIINAVVDVIKPIITWIIENIPPINTRALHLAIHARKWRTRKKNAKRIFDVRRTTQCRNTKNDYNKSE